MNPRRTIFLLLTGLAMVVGGGVAALGDAAGARAAGTAHPAVGSVGRGRGITRPSRRTSPCGSGAALRINYDGSAENAYCWEYGGLVPPYYGAFAECYNDAGRVCGIELQLTGIGAPCTPCDLYVWSDAGGVPGNVLSYTSGANPCPVATWPNISAHDFAINPCAVNGPYWVGFWAGVDSHELCPYYVAADLDGCAGGCPMTNVAPGIGYPTGWQNVSIIWGPTQAIGIGAWVLPPPAPTPPPVPPAARAAAPLSNAADLAESRSMGGPAPFPAAAPDLGSPFPGREDPVGAVGPAVPAGSGSRTPSDTCAVPSECTLPEPVRSSIPNGLAHVFADRFWMTGHDPLMLYLIKAGASGCCLIDSCQSPGNIHPSELAYDQGYLYEYDFGTGLIYQIDPNTCQVVATCDPPGDDLAEGLTIDPASDPAHREFWKGDSHKLYRFRFDLCPAVADDSCPNPSYNGHGDSADGLTFCGSSLMMLGYSGRLYRINPQTCQYTSCALPALAAGNAYNGLESDENGRILTTQRTGVIDFIPCPSCADCPPGAQNENEPDCRDGYVDTYDGDCLHAIPISDQGGGCGVMCGRSGTFLTGGHQQADIDYYRICSPPNENFSLQITPQFPCNLQIWDSSCGILIESIQVDSCQTGACPPFYLSPEYVIAVQPSVVTGVPCGTPYVLSVCGMSCPGQVDQKPLPPSFVLYQNHPNPGRPGTEIAFDLPRDGQVELRVFDAFGRLVTTLQKGKLAAGRHRVPWDGRNSSGVPAGPGMYFYQLRAGVFVESRKMLILS